MNDSLENDKHHEDRFRLLSEAAFEGICIHDQGIILDANQQFCEMFGYSLEELQNMNAFNLIAPQSKQMVKEHISKGFLGPYESFQQKKNGSIFPVEIRARELQIDGKFLRIAVFRDLTERKEMEKQIAENEKKYRELYDHSPIGLFRARISDGKLLECNQALADIFGHENKEEMLSIDSVQDGYANANDRKRFLEKLKKNKKVNAFQSELKRKDGYSIWVEINAELFPERDFMAGSMQDITASVILTKSEKKVFRLVVDGKSNKEIARTLNRSVRTIEDHRSHIMHKLNVNNLPDLVRKAPTLRSESDEDD